MIRIALLAAGFAFLATFSALTLVDLQSARHSLERARTELIALDDHQSDLLTSGGRAQARLQLEQAAARQRRLGESSAGREGGSWRQMKKCWISLSPGSGLWFYA